MYYMLVKDASIYEETTWYTEYAGEHPILLCTLTRYFPQG